MKVQAKKKPTANKKRGLGRGLDALLNDVNTTIQENINTETKNELPINYLIPGIGQPRKHFNDESLISLTNSIREKGILQPLLVRPITENKYEIIAGERRFRAAQRANLESVPVAIMNLTDKEAYEIALIENIQREDLSPIEEAEGYQSMMENFGYTQNMLSESLGKSRSHIANTLRLLSLPNEIKEMIDDGQITSGHARALIGVENANEMAKQIINNSLTVRETENIVAQKKNNPNKKSSSKSEFEKIAIQTLSNSLGCKSDVSIKKSGGGKISITFSSEDELNQLINKIIS